MLRLSIVAVFGVLLCGTDVFAQLPNQHGQIWREYDLRSVTMPPPTITVPHGVELAKLPIQAPSIIEIVKRETGEAAWSGPGFGLIGTDGQRLFVYNTPAVQQRVAETIGRFQRPETQNVQFVIESTLLAISDNFYERMGHSFDVVFRNDAVSITPSPRNVELDRQAVAAQRLLQASLMDAGMLTHQNLRPLLGADGTPVSKQPGVAIYWVAREDMPKVSEAFRLLFTAIRGDRRSDIMELPRIIARNGELNVRSDTLSAIQAENMLASFSLLSWDGRTVSSDMYADCSLFDGKVRVGLGDIPIPKVERMTMSEKGLVWSSDGMLVVFIRGIERLTEAEVEAGTPMPPILGRIPYFQRLFRNTAIGRYSQSLTWMITVRMLPLDESPRTAGR